VAETSNDEAQIPELTQQHWVSKKRPRNMRFDAIVIERRFQPADDLIGVPLLRFFSNFNGSIGRKKNRLSLARFSGAAAP